jgi:hypothetical protein
MQKRRLSPHDVELVLRIGEGYEEDDGTWVYAFTNIRVVIVERRSAAHVVTEMRLRSHT